MRQAIYLLLAFAVHLSANAQYVQYDSVPNTSIRREERLRQRDVTFLCPQSQARTAAACLNNARTKLQGVCNLGSASAQTVCARRQLAPANDAMIVIADEWWCSVESTNCVTTLANCGPQFTEQNLRRTREVAFNRKVCRMRSAAPARSGDQPRTQRGTR